MNKAPLSDVDAAWLHKNKIPFFLQKQSATFFAHCDLILPSPGIDLAPFPQIHQKMYTEVDLFAQHWHKPIIAVTGTMGKTSIVQLLAQLLATAGMRVGLAGNVGTSMLTLIDQQHELDWALLELSSFQLEWAQQFAPDLAIITNVHPNHLDRHKTFDAYLQAKLQIVAHQRPDQRALLPHDMHQLISGRTTAKIFWHTPEQATCQPAYTVDDSHIIHCTGSTHKPLLPCVQLPPISFIHNWLIIAATLDLLGIELAPLLAKQPHLQIDAHRLEQVATIDGVAFYNDSKATIPHATVAAVAQLAQFKKIILLLGGLDKGVDRTPLIQELAHTGRIAHVAAFGAQAQEIARLCTQAKLPCSAHATLEDAFARCTKKEPPGECVLLSPGGASFDLFKNYEERGRRFCELVRAYHTW